MEGGGGMESQSASIIIRQQCKLQNSGQICTVPLIV